MSPTDSETRSDAEFVTFFAGGQSFSLDISHVREIRRWSSVTPLPHAPPEVLGVMNLRGSVIPIYDLSARFGLGLTADNPRNVVVVATIGNQIVGLLVESVSRILSVSKTQIEDTPDISCETTRAAIAGIIQMEEGMTRVINPDAVIQKNNGRAA